MASKGKEVRRPDLIIPYQEPAASGDAGDFSSTISSTLPMAAIFLRNRYVGWAAFVYSVQTWLGESEDSKKSSSTPGYLSVGMSLMSLMITYLPLFLPPPPTAGGTATEAFPPAPPS